MTPPRTSSPVPSPWVKVVLPAPSSPVRTTRSPADQAAADPLPQQPHRRRRPGRRRRCPARARARRRGWTCRSPRSRAAPRSRPSRAAPRARRPSPPSVLRPRRRPPRPARWRRRGPARAGVTPKRRSTSAVGRRVEHDAPDGHAVDRREEAAAPAQQAGDRVDVLAERVGGRVEDRSRAERALHDGEHVSGGLRRRRGVRRRSPQRLPLGQRDEVVELRGDLLVPLEQHHVAGPLALEQARARDAAVQLAGCGRPR